jgi:hypothetical protein
MRSAKRLEIGRRSLAIVQPELFTCVVGDFTEAVSLSPFW